jgi:hypothetical protein
MSIIDKLAKQVGFEPPKPPTPEEELYIELTTGKYPAIFNCHYWLKCELSVYKTLKEAGLSPCHVAKTGRPIAWPETVAKVYLKHYFRMVMLPKFENETAEARGIVLPDLDQFVRLLMERDGVIQKLTQNPDILI